ncbi:Trafficking protein particle complex subunit 4 [Gracilariopsis chorda]|uniref:Trafficking protein particle complex subunit n=1 Tax=Gracilariopsis chorda TaxID=448386 RepID=A0A2V3IL55_9FLOR|nr:Trafficking protein particle complex subunit 4 [Gracilariopsis chorda]|eukprot:PXF42788.1 Trafficking protein particle complex subunit 4 [Gracilariopsis chorda]
MGLQYLFVINKAGSLIFDRRLSENAPQLSPNDCLHLASTFHGMQLLVQQLSPEPSDHGFGIVTLETESYVLQAYRPETGVQFFVTADLKTENLAAFLRDVYVIYADYVMKNPFYELDMPIKVDRWEAHLKRLVDKYNNRVNV